MTNVDWMLRGAEIVTCNCDYGCPCQFNALPTRGSCSASIAMRIDEGRFGDVDLSGVKVAMSVAWPGAIHEGRGVAQIAVDSGASAAQREAILRILAGEETEPGATIFNVFASVIDTVHEPLFRPVAFEADIAAGTGRFAVEGFADAAVEPIRNPVTGQPHRARVTLPTGFEYHEADYVSSTTRTEGKVAHEWSGRHGHMAMLQMTGKGVVHSLPSEIPESAPAGVLHA